MKPLTSSSTSSERFLVCRGFQGCKSIATEVGDKMMVGLGYRERRRGEEEGEEEEREGESLQHEKAA